MRPLDAVARRVLELDAQVEPAAAGRGGRGADSLTRNLCASPGALFRPGRLPGGFYSVSVDVADGQVAIDLRDQGGAYLCQDARVGGA